MNAPSPDDPAAMGPDDFEALEALLDALRERGQAAPEWEFCEGFMAALICCRRAIPPSEYLPVLFSGGEEPADGPLPAFADAAEMTRFMALWTRRWNEVATSLDQEPQALDEDGCYAPEVLDLRGMVAALPPEERERFAAEPVPSFAQLWAEGYLAAVDCWPDDWAPPRDREQAEWIADCLASIETVAGDDEEEATLSPFGDDAPPSVSAKRLEDYGEAIWAVYDLRAIWRSLGPRVTPMRKAHEPGRNEPCPCGSGRKYKHCHGAN